MIVYDYIIIIDEFLTTDKPLIRMIYHKLREFKGVVILIGDIRQNAYLLEKREVDRRLKPVGYKYGFDKCDMFGDLVGFRRLLQKGYEGNVV